MEKVDRMTDLAALSAVCCGHEAGSYQVENLALIVSMTKVVAPDYGKP